MKAPGASLHGLRGLLFPLLLLLLACLASVNLPAQTRLNVRTSWLGNTFGFGDGKWTPIDIAAIAVAPDGTVYTNSGWDESGAESSIFKDGNMLGSVGDTHGWGYLGGKAIAINSKYAYIAISIDNQGGSLAGPSTWPAKGLHWFGVSRRELADPRRPAPFRPVANIADRRTQLAASFLVVNEVHEGDRGEVGGLAANDTTLYVANTQRDRIESYDAQTMQPRETIEHVESPGHLALAPDGSLWALTDTAAGTRPRVAHFTAAGVRLADTLPLPADTVPVDIAVDKTGRVLVADNGPRQQVLYFTKHDDGRYAAAGELGERGGIFSGVPGRIGPKRFNGLTGVGVDAQGNVYVSTNGIGRTDSTTVGSLGTTLESYAPDGRQRWQVQGLLFVDGAWIDPARPDSVYTGNKRFELDLSKPAGKDWKYVGFLTNRFRYPDDPVLHTDGWAGMPIARSVKGQTLLYLTDMYADHLKIYRFDAAHEGETAIPAGFFATSAEGVKNIPQTPKTGEWIWRDANGNGRFEPGEFTPNTSGTPMAGGWGWWVDSAGDVWRTRASGIYRFRFGGFDAHGNPVYAYQDMTAYAMPQPFTELRRAIYAPDTDSLYVTGYTSGNPADSRFWKEAGRVLVRYDHWSGGKPEPRYTVVLPWQTQGNATQTIIGVTVEGQYIFAVEAMSATVHVFDKDSGKEVGAIRPGPEVGNTSGWVDVPNGISATRRGDGDGEYLVFVEEDARGKVLMYRWKP